MSDLLRLAEEIIVTRSLLKPGQAVLVAVSGGLDSMVLLALLARLAKAQRWRLVVAHLNHGLRRSSSDADERLVRKAAARLGLPCVIERAAVRALAREEKVSLEMAGRRLRHEFLARTARRRRLRAVALAHHADDQVETFFLRLFRGAGGQGLAGMKWAGPSPADRNLTVVRPLLEVSRRQLFDFARAEKIAFREDASNASLDILRNRVRHELLPLLTRDYQPALRRVVLREMEILGAEADVLDDLSQHWREHDLAATFENLPAAIQRRILQQELIRLGVRPEFDWVEQLRRQGAVTVGLGRIFRLTPGGRVVPQLPPAAERNNGAQMAIPLEGRRGHGKFAGLNWSWACRPAKAFEKPAFGAGCEWFDADKLGAEVVLRHWQAGDRYRPVGLRIAVKLQDLFTNLKVPRERRHQLVVAATREGEIWWVEGLRIADQFKLEKRTRRWLRWQWRRRSD